MIVINQDDKKSYIINHTSYLPCTSCTYEDVRFPISNILTLMCIIMIHSL